MTKKIMGFIMVLLVAGALRAQKQEIFAPEGKALRGYDPVAFFTKAMPVHGFDSLSTEWKSVKWLFSSKENLESFKRNPEKYEPQYGGYCAYGISQGHKAPTLPETWTIIDQKLYFNYNSKVKEQWIKNTDGLIAKANMQWPEVKDKE